MELSKDKVEAMKQLMAMLVQNREDVLACARGNSLTYVVCFANDYLPFRVGGDGRISAFGGAVYVNTSRKDAGRVATELAKQAKRNGASDVIVLPVDEWCAQRVRVINGLIASWKQSAAEQGIALEVK